MAVRIDSVRFRVVEVLVLWVVHDGGVGFWVATEDDAIHRVDLVVKAACPPIFLRVKVADGEEWKPCAAIREGAVD